jgi:hypothetical protein
MLRQLPLILAHRPCFIRQGVEKRQRHRVMTVPPTPLHTAPAAPVYLSSTSASNPNCHIRACSTSATSLPHPGGLELPASSCTSRLSLLTHRRALQPSKLSVTRKCHVITLRGLQHQRSLLLLRRYCTGRTSTISSTMMWGKQWLSLIMTSS